MIFSKKKIFPRGVEEWKDFFLCNFLMGLLPKRLCWLQRYGLLEISLKDVPLVNRLIAPRYGNYNLFGGIGVYCMETFPLIRLEWLLRVSKKFNREQEEKSRLLLAASPMLLLLSAIPFSMCGQKKQESSQKKNSSCN